MQSIMQNHSKPKFYSHFQLLKVDVSRDFSCCGTDPLLVMHVQKAYTLGLQITIYFGQDLHLITSLQVTVLGSLFP